MHFKGTVRVAVLVGVELTWTKINDDLIINLQWRNNKNNVKLCRQINSQSAVSASFAIVVSEWGQLARIKLVPDELRRQTARVTAERNSQWWVAPENGARQLFCPKWLINVDKKWGITVRALCIGAQSEGSQCRKGKGDRRGHPHQPRCHWGGKRLQQGRRLFYFLQSVLLQLRVASNVNSTIWHTLLHKVVTVQRHWQKMKKGLESVIGRTACDKLGNF